jgi:hypothetical protein
MLSLFSKWILAVSVLMISSLNNAIALTSTGFDGAFSLNHTLIMNASNNQTFNFTTFNLQTNGTRDFLGLSNTDSIFILASGDVHLDSILNLSSNITFETSGSVFVNGTINAGANSLTILSNTLDIAKKADINTAGGNQNNSKSRSGSCLNIRGFTCYKTPIPGSIEAGNGGVSLNPGGSYHLTLTRCQNPQIMRCFSLASAYLYCEEIIFQTRLPETLTRIIAFTIIGF